MFAKSEVQTLPVLRELTGEALPDGLLADARRLALQTAQATPLPFWRRTNLKDFKLDDLQPVFGTVEIQPVGGEEGVYVADFQTAQQERAELIAQYYGKGIPVNYDTFVAYNTALSIDGVVVHVPRNVELDEPIRITYRLPAGGVAIFPRTLVVAEPNSRVTVVEEFQSDDLDSYGLVVPVAELFANEGSEIRFISLQTLGKNAYHLGAQEAVVGKDARIWWLSGAVGATVQHVEMRTRLEGNGSSLEWRGFSFANDSQQIYWGPKVNHIGRDTEGAIEWKSAVADSAYVVFDGMIDIEKGAQGTNSDLRDAALHLSEKARSDSIPGLEIDANEVKAGHGSTSGQIDDDQLFYLMTRGLTRAEATRMLVLGFFASIAEQIPVDDVQQRALELIEAKI